MSKDGPLDGTVVFNTRSDNASVTSVMKLLGRTFKARNLIHQHSKIKDNTRRKYELPRYLARRNSLE